MKLRGVNIVQKGGVTAQLALSGYNGNIAKMAFRQRHPMEMGRDAFFGMPGPSVIESRPKLSGIMPNLRSNIIERICIF